MLIDSHVHLYDTNGLTYDWVDGLGDLDRPHLLDEYRDKVADAGVTGFVFVDAACAWDQSVAEAEWVASLADDQAPALLGIVAGLQVESPDRGERLDKLAAIPLVKGVRRLIEPDVTLIDNQAFVDGVRRVGQAGFSFDICCKSHQLDAVVRLVDACPDVPFILDHLGKPDIEGEEWQPWADNLTALSNRENLIAAKLSGLFSEGPRDRAPCYLDHAIEVLTPSRLMIGGDWPVCDEAESVGHWFGDVDQTIKTLSDAERDAIRFGTALSAYRLTP